MSGRLEAAAEAAGPGSSIRPVGEQGADPDVGLQSADYYTRRAERLMRTGREASAPLSRGTGSDLECAAICAQLATAAATREQTAVLERLDMWAEQLAHNGYGR